jgi:hypothetical protein
MAQKKTKKNNKPQQPISPKKYIIEAARKVPIFECVINEDWAEGGIAQIMVARQKRQGSFIVGVYIVDTFCLGLKNTLFYGNLTPYEYEEQKSKVARSTQLTWQQIPANTCFNIIYGAIEYAEDMGFQPNKDFDVTEYILDDVESIEFEDIEFGKNGKPFYFGGPHDDYRKVMSTLNRNVGEGRFDYVLPMGMGDRSLSGYDRNVANNFDDDDYEFIDETPSINILTDFKEEVNNPENIIATFIKAYQSTINVQYELTLPFICFFPNKKELEQKYVDQNLIKGIVSFFQDHYLMNNSLDVHINISAQALSRREDELFEGIFDVEDTELRAENKKLDGFLAHFPQLLEDPGISNCIKNDHLFAYIENIYEDLKDMPLRDDYKMELSISLSEEQDDAPMRFIISLSIQDESYDDE